MNADLVRAGAVVKVTLTVGRDWDGVLCDVERVYMRHGQLVAQVVPVFDPPAVPTHVPVNELSIELVVPPTTQQTHLEDK